MSFTNNTGREYHFEQSGLNIWRSKFDYRISMKAKEAVAELIDETAVLSCSEKNDALRLFSK